MKIIEKKTIPCALAFVLTAWSATIAADDEKKMTTLIPEHSVRSVVMYPDSAILTRTAEVTLVPGRNIIRWEGVPGNLMENSIRLEEIKNFTGTVIGLSKERIRRQVYLTQKEMEWLKEEEKRADALNLLINERDTLNFRKKNLQHSLEQLKFVINEQGFKASGDDDAKQWRASEEKLSDELRKNEDALFALNKKIKDEKKAFDHVKEQLSQKTRSQNGTLNFIVTLDAKEKQTLPLRVSYRVDCAYWVPKYAVRLDGEKRVILEYSAEVMQETDENWTDVQISVGTEPPKVSDTPPPLKTLTLNGKRVENEARRIVSAKTELDMPLPPPTEPTATPREESEAPEEFHQNSDNSSLESRSRSRWKRGNLPVVTYPIEGKFHLSGTGFAEKIPVMKKEFAATVENLCVPSFKPLAFKKASFANTTDYTLLPGDAQIFTDGVYIGTSKFGIRTPGTGVEFFAGAVDGISIHASKPLPFVRTVGTFTKTEERYVGEGVKILNLSGKTVRLSVLMNVPVSEVSEVSVRIADKPPENAPNPMNPTSPGYTLEPANGIVTWTLESANGSFTPLHLLYCVSTKQ